MTINWFNIDYKSILIYHKQNHVFHKECFNSYLKKYAVQCTSWPFPWPTFNKQRRHRRRIVFFITSSFSSHFDIKYLFALSEYCFFRHAMSWIIFFYRLQIIPRTSSLPSKEQMLDRARKGILVRLLQILISWPCWCHDHFLLLLDLHWSENTPLTFSTGDVMDFWSAD